MPAQLSQAHLPLPWEAGSVVPADAGLRRLALVGAALMTGMLVLAMVVPVGSAVIAAGQVGVDGRVKRIAHPTGGVIREIDVFNGEHVEKGQVLMRLDDTVTGAEAKYAQYTLEQLMAQRARLDAERTGADTITFPKELSDTGTPSAKRAMQEERHLFDLRNSEQAQLQAQFAARETEYREQMAGLSAQLASVRQQRSLIEPELKGVRDLWNRQLVTINRLNALERTAIDLDGSRGALLAQIAQARAQITETRQQSIQIVQQRRAEAGAELAQVNGALNLQRSRSISASEQHVRSEIRAPYSGTIEKIAFAAIGDVVRPAEAIMEIVPDKERMVIEAAVQPQDVDQILVGQPVRIRFSAFNRATTPEIGGRLTYVAANDSQVDQRHDAHFRIRVAIDAAQLRRSGMSLRSGMPAEVYIETGNRSLLSYLTKPLRDQFDRAFRDE